MYRYSKSKTSLKKTNENTTIANKSHARTETKNTVQLKNNISSSFNQEYDGENQNSNSVFYSDKPILIQDSLSQIQLVSKQEQKEPQPLPTELSEEQERLTPATAKPNDTGIPLQMKEDFERFSGFSFDDVKVHYNSDKPDQLQALAYTQGNQVHIAPGQEKHLPHELSHVVQQKQGVVKPTKQLNNVNINNDESLEHSADNIAVQAKTFDNYVDDKQLSHSNVVVQRMIRINAVPKTIAALSSMVFNALRSKYSSFDGRRMKEIITEMDREVMDFDDDEAFIKHVESVMFAPKEDEEPGSDEDTGSDGDTDTSSSSSEAPPEALPDRFSTPVKTNNGFIFMSYAGKPVVLYRSMEGPEYEQLMATIAGEGLPVFKYKPGKKSTGNSEKFFAPNIRYLASGMSKKGSRMLTVKISLHPSVLSDLIYNPEFAGVESNTMDKTLKEKGLKRVQPDTPIIIKRESGKAMSSSSENIGFRLSGGKLADFSQYIISLALLGDDFSGELDEDPVTSLRGFTPEYLEIDEDDEEFMQVDGNLFTIDGRTYDVISNQVPPGHCLWALLKGAGIPEAVLRQAAEDTNMVYNDFVETDDIEALIEKINELSPDNQLTVSLDVFSYEGIYYGDRRLVVGSGGTQLSIGLVFDSYGFGHYISAQ